MMLHLGKYTIDLLVSLCAYAYVYVCFYVCKCTCVEHMCTAYSCMKARVQCTKLCILFLEKEFLTGT